MVLFMPRASHAVAQQSTPWELGFHHRHWNGSCERGTFVVAIATRYLFDDVLADGFFTDLVAALNAAGAQHAVLDFQHVEAVSGSALDALAELSSWLGKRRGQLVLCGLSEPLAELCHVAELGGTGSCWKTEQDVAAALSYLRRLKLSS